MPDSSFSIQIKPTDKKANQPTASVSIKTENDVNDKIINDGFFPDISLSAMRESMRLDGTVTDVRLKDALLEAIIAVNQELEGLKNATPTRHQLVDKQSDAMNANDIFIHRYQRAVYCLALAALYERYASYDFTKEGERKSQQLDYSIRCLRRDGRFAISDLLARNRVVSELI